MEKLKIIFAGTPEFAVPFLKALIDDEAFEVVAVITQADKPSGRKKELIPSPVKQLALTADIQIFQPSSMRRDIDLADKLKSLNYDIMVVVAYGQIIPQAILDIAKIGNINVHPSLLPKYRGASPIQAAILAGEQLSGLSIMLMDDKMDHGPILRQENIVLAGDETNESLHQKMAQLGSPLLLQTIKDFADKKISAKRQDDNQATFCKPINKEDARIDWEKSAIEIERRIRAYFPWPVAWSTYEDKRIKFFPKCEVVVATSTEVGILEVADDEVLVGCGQHKLKLSRIQLEGKKDMTAKDFINGNKLTGKKFI